MRRRSRSSKSRKGETLFFVLVIAVLLIEDIFFEAECHAFFGENGQPAPYTCFGLVPLFTALTLAFGGLSLLWLARKIFGWPPSTDQ